MTTTTGTLQAAVTAELTEWGRTPRWARLLGQLTTMRNAQTRAARSRPAIRYPLTDLTPCEESA